MPRKRPYGQFCPIATALDQVGDRWTLLILREFFVGPVRYGQLRDSLRPIPTDVLAGRLKQLETLGLIQHLPGDRGYDLTSDGRDLAPVLGALGGWGASRMSPPDDESVLTTPMIIQLLAISTAADTSDTEKRVELRSDGESYSITRTANGTVVRRTPAQRPHAIVTAAGVTLWTLGAGLVGWDEAINSGDVILDGDSAIAEALLLRPHTIPLSPDR